MTADTLSKAKQIILEQDAELRRIAEKSNAISTIIGEKDKYVFLFDGRVSRVLKPAFPVEIGDKVTIAPMSGQIVERVYAVPAFGESHVITTPGKKKSEIGTKIVFNGIFSPKSGDRVVLDTDGIVILDNLGPEKAKYVPAVPDITWDDIGGLEEAKEQMIEAVELPHKNKELFTYYNKRPTKGILLYGPPGNGKTLLGKAAANSLAAIYKKTGSNSGFMYIKGPEILNPYVGLAEEAIRSLFIRARMHKEEHGYPAVIFIDEADSILAARGSDTPGHMEHTIVPMFLTEMDGMEDSAALLILATNRPDMLDPAIVRDGRIDRKIKVSRPKPAHAADILFLNLGKVPLSAGLDAEDLATQIAAEAYSKKRKLYTVHTADEEKHPITLADFISGAMLVGMVDYAMSLAMRRDMKTGKRSGLCYDDLMSAVDNVQAQLKDINHQQQIADFIEDRGIEPVHIRKAAA